VSLEGSVTYKIRIFFPHFVDGYFDAILAIQIVV
jgi:hypothetical protein